MRRAALAALFAFAAAALPAAQEKEEKKDEPQPSAEEKALLEMTNKERVKADLPPLAFNAVLFRAARGHSENMAKQGKLEHVLDGKNPSERLAAAGYQAAYYGENIAWGDRMTLKSIMEGWMESPRHKANILNKEFTEVGVGVARAPNGEMYYTQVFGKPRKR